MKKLLRIIIYVYQNFFEMDCANRAASLAYTTLLSIVPSVMIGFWILSQFPAFQGAGEAMQQFVVNNFVAHSAQVISEQLDHFLEQTKVLSWGTLLALAVVSVLMIYDMVNAFNSIWQIKMRRNFALTFSFYSLVLLFAPIVFGIFMVMTSYLSTLPFIAEVAFLEKPMVYLLPYLVAFLIFTFLNWVLPSCRVPFRNAIIAGFITTLLFEIIKYLFGLYMSYFPTYRVIYGALATIPIFLLWIYTSWVIILLGAMICPFCSMTRAAMILP
jgi:membrane protein